jgi:hypothetical protein
VGGGLALFALLQVIPYGRNHTNPPVVAEPGWNNPQTRETFYRTCGDCHSNQTTWPWYSNVAPVSWLVQRDVEEGRSKFNVSDWGRGRNESDEAAEAVQKGKMPMPVYLITHAEARLSAGDKRVFIQGLVATFGGEGAGEGEEDDD